MTAADAVLTALGDAALGGGTLVGLAVLAWAANGAMRDRQALEAEARMRERVELAREAEHTRRRIRAALD